MSEKPYVCDIESRAFFINRAMVHAPEEIIKMCLPLVRMSQEYRDRIVARLEREETRRLYGKRLTRQEWERHCSQLASVKSAKRKRAA